MKTVSPATSRSLRRRFSCTTFIGARSLRGLSEMNMRPLFCAPPPPLNELTAATLGSARTIAAARSCSCTISGKLVSSAASVLAWIWPMSSSGKKPLGMATNSHAVAAKVSSAITSTKPRWRSAMSSVRVYLSSVQLKHALEAAHDQAGLLLVRVVGQEAAGQHRHQGQRDKRRDHDGQPDDDRKFVEQQPDDARHEEDRDEHRPAMC